MNTPLRFNIRDAVGLALRDSGVGPAADGVRAARHPARTVSTGSNLEALGGDNQTWDAVSSGSASVSHFFIAPDNKVYVLFNGGAFVSVAGTPALCTLAEVDRETGVPTCIDSTNMIINWAPGMGDPIQFDGAGAIYYSACPRSSSNCYLRRYLNGVATDVFSGVNSEVVRFVVTPDGSVFASIFTFTQGPSWTEAISPSGQITRISDTQEWFLKFPDGNIYMPVLDQATGISGIRRYLTQTGQMDPEYWVGGSGQSAHNDAQAICAQQPPQLQTSAFCTSSGGGMGWAMSTSDGREFVIVGTGPQSVLMQYYPTVQFTSTGVLHPTVAGTVGDKIALVGLDSTGNRVLALYDPATGTDRQLPSPAPDFVVTSLTYFRSMNVLVLGGQDASDPFKPLAAQVDLNTGELSRLSDGARLVNSLQAFYASQG